MLLGACGIKGFLLRKVQMKISRASWTISLLVFAGAYAVFGAEMPTGLEYVNSLGMKLVRIEPGAFSMGFEGGPLSDAIITIPDDDGGRKREYVRRGNYDEHPRRKVTISKAFYMGVYEVTNSQYEQFDPKHRKLRGTRDRSANDDDAVIMVNWSDAAEFCQWLSAKEGLPYRLATEAEWEYACRAGTSTYFNTGDSLAEHKTPANAWGLHNMHGGVEEWCYDWYGPYESGPQTDPVGRVDSDFKVTRGGADSAKVFYKRSANRSGTVADDKSWLIGFRVVLGELPKTKPLPVVRQPYQQNVTHDIPKDLEKGPGPQTPYFEIRTYINIDKDAEGPLFYLHNHNPDITQCPNGDLLAIHFSTIIEGDREMVYGGSRLRYGSDKWDRTSVFWGPPDRKAEYSVLWTEGNAIYNFSSLGVSNSRPSAIVMRISRDNGVSWSKPQVIAERADAQGVMETVFRMSNGGIVIPADGHNLLVSYDNDRRWKSPCGADNGPKGIHTPVVELSNGHLMAFGRYDDIDGMMPKSVSSDGGKTWAYSKSIFGGIGGGQRATMLRLKEGPIFFASFAKTKAKKMTMTDGAGETNVCNGLYAALSFDEGKTWPIIRLISDGSGRKVFTRKNKFYKMTKTKSEGNGYLASCQSADGVIHMVSNRVEYAFNLKWLRPDLGADK
jgi:formylglycine-generating enzyme required for sulfatase activity